MRVSNGHLNGLVPHEFLNGAEIHSSHHQTTGKRVAQTVPSESLSRAFGLWETNRHGTASLRAHNLSFFNRLLDLPVFQKTLHRYDVSRSESTDRDLDLCFSNGRDSADAFSTKEWDSQH